MKDDPQLVRHIFLDKVYMKEIKLPAGARVITHKHIYDHGSVLAQGSVEVTVDGVEKTYFAPDVIAIRKGQQHEIRAVSDACWYCVHAIPPEFSHGDIDGILIER